MTPAMMMVASEEDMNDQYDQYESSTLANILIPWESVDFAFVGYHKYQFEYEATYSEAKSGLPHAIRVMLGGRSEDIYRCELQPVMRGRDLFRQSVVMTVSYPDAWLHGIAQQWKVYWWTQDA